MADAQGIEYVDRYSALGMAPPDPETMCPGDCEGTGIYPEPRTVDADGRIPVTTEWDFVTCATCGGHGGEAGLNVRRRAGGGEG